MRVASTEQISRLYTRPARTPVNASPPPSRATAHDSENKMDRYSFLVGLLHPRHHAGFAGAFVAVGTALRPWARAAPRTDPGVRDYRTGLLP